MKLNLGTFYLAFLIRWKFSQIFIFKDYDIPVASTILKSIRQL